jgi:NAD(P)-dependent dehydrogenase (short-subunit alcohol dehydrogenase family)
MRYHRNMSGSEAERVAIVTGANRGMGLETCRQLAAKGLRVVLTSRDESRGRAAAAALKDEGHDVDFHQLDVTDADSLAALAGHLAATYDRLDVLVNNAGALFDDDANRALDTARESIRRSFETNCLGALAVCQALVPLMVKNRYGRIVNVSDVIAATNGDTNGRPALQISKAALNAVTRLLAAELEGTGVLVNASWPGRVQTEMGGSDAPLSVEEGVDTTVWLATLRDDGPTGGLFQDNKVIRW